MCRQKDKTVKCADCPKSVTSPGGFRKRCGTCHKRYKANYQKIYQRSIKAKKDSDVVSIDWLHMQD